MARTRLVRLELSNFRSYRRKSVIEFPASGLVLLEGKNLDTKGSSGAGKSTIPLAINFALGWCDIPATELLSWGSDTPAKVGLTLDCDGQEVIIGRGKSFTLKIDGVEYEGSVKQKDEKLRSLLSIDPELMEALTYRGQREPGLLLSKKDAEKKEFFTKVLHLDRFETAVETGGKKVTELESQVATFKTEKETLAHTLKELCHPETVDSLQNHLVLLEDVLTKKMKAYEEAGRAVAVKRLETTAFKADSETAAKYAFDAWAEDIAAALAMVNAPAPKFEGESSPELAKLNQTEEQLRARVQRLGKEDDQERAALDRKRADYNRAIQGMTMKLGAVVGLKKEKSRLEAEMEKLVASMCPTCEREWDQVEGKRQQVRQAIADVTTEILLLTEVETKIKGLRVELAAVPVFQPNPMLAKMEEAYSQARARVAAELQRLASARALHEAEAQKGRAVAKAAHAAVLAKAKEAEAIIRDGTRKRLEELNVEVENLRLACQEADDEVKRGRQTKDWIKEKLTQAEKLQVRMVIAEMNEIETQTKLNAEKDFLITIKGFLGSIFDEVLEEISDETNKILAAVANTRHCTLQFRSEGVTQKGNIRKEIKPIVTIGGYEAPLESGLSGGMYSAVELAVDLAAGRVISQRSGIQPGWLVLDESFDGLDVVSKEACLEVLNRFGQDRLVLVADHMSETKGIFTQRITVTFSKGESTV